MYNCVCHFNRESMAVKSKHDVTLLLQEWRQGDQGALEKLMPLVYEELRRLAHRYMTRERAGHTLQTTALVNEAYLRLVDASHVPWQNRTHFFAISANLMRRILLDFARKRGYKKRGGDARRVDFDEAFFPSRGRDADLIALDDALNTLAELDPRKAKVVELRYFGGLTPEETAGKIVFADVVGLHRVSAAGGSPELVARPEGDDV